MDSKSLDETQLTLLNLFLLSFQILHTVNERAMNSDLRRPYKGYEGRHLRVDFGSGKTGGVVSSSSREVLEVN